MNYSSEVNTQNAFIAKLEALINEERVQKIDDVEKVVAHLKSTIQAWKELRQLYDTSLDLEHEQEEFVNDLQEDIGQKLNESENKKVADLWRETSRLKKELEIEKVEELI